MPPDLRVVIVGLSVVAACRPVTTQTVTPGPGPLAPTVIAPPAAPTASAKGPAKPPKVEDSGGFPAVATFVTTGLPKPRVFTDGGSLTFGVGAGLKQRKLAKGLTWGGTSADGIVSVLGFDMKGTILTQQKPQGVSFPASHVARTVFSQDGSRVAVLQYLGASVVLDTSTGAVVFDRKGALECDARFLDNGHVRLHEESKSKDARLYDLDLATGKHTPRSGQRRIDRCAGSPDGKTWLLVDDYAKDARVVLLRPGPDPASTVLEAVAKTDGDGAVLSPVADRVCFYEAGAVKCLRADHGAETVVSGLNGASLEIDDTGARMLIMASYYDKNEEPRSMVLLADFAAGTTRKLLGPALASGGSVHLMSGGTVIAAGSSGGVTAWDTDKKLRHFLPHNAMYTVHAIAGAPRRIACEEDNGGDPYLVDLP